MKLRESIEDYLRYLQFEQGAAKTTYKSYHAYLNNFHKWLVENGYPEPDFTDFNTATVRRFFYFISAKGLRPRSIYGYMIPLRSYGTFLLGQGILEENPTLAIRLPKKDAAIRKDTSEEEIMALLGAVNRQGVRQRFLHFTAISGVEALHKFGHMNV